MAKLKYRDDFPLLAEGYAREGLSDAQIAEKLRISIQSFYTYQKKYKEFFEAIKKGKQPIDIKVENALLKRALGYEYEEETKELVKGKDGKLELKVTKKVKKHVLPDTTAQIFWLKNRRPDRWRDVHKIDHGGEIKTGVDFSGITTEELRKILKEERD